MAMTRAELLTAATSELPELIAEAGLTANETAFGGAIDAALRGLGRSSATLADPVADAQESAAIALARWRVLERVHAALLTTWTNSDFDGPLSRLQMVESLKRLEERIAAAKADADLQLGAIGGASWAFGALNLGYLGEEVCL